MSILAFLIIGSLALVTLAVIGWFLTTSHVPENASERDPSEVADMRSKGMFAPADADAEPMNPDALGGDQSPPSS